MITYVTTCDQTMHIVPAMMHQINKYWSLGEIKILGYSDPGVKGFVSMKKYQRSVDDWARDLYSVIKNDHDDLVILTTDDSLLNAPCDNEVIDAFVDQMKDKEVFRCGMGKHMQLYPHKTVRKYEGFEVIEIDRSTPYRLACGWSLWRKDVLLHYLRKSKSPWHFETAHDPPGRLLASKGRYGVSYVIEGCISSRRIGNKINVLGLKTGDVEQMIAKGLLNRSVLQLGNYRHRAKARSHNIKPYYKGFKLKDLKGLLKDIKYNSYEFLYSNV